MLIIALVGAIVANPPVVTVDRDNIQITQSCTIEVRSQSIEDTDGNGVIHITANDVVVDFLGATFHGAADDSEPSDYSGIGIRISGTNVTLKHASVSGFKVGIYATNADGLVIEDCDVSDNYRQHLRSTPKAEDGADWLWPHNNDKNEWLTDYGAGLYVENSNEVTLRRIRARHGQNGIILDQVNDSVIYDNDCSFLSGWGLAMWRSSRNVISRNAFDFCVRGYSHGVYNRGQDSAGLLMFEQCNDNVIVENSITHGGDGIFAFAGREALGEVWFERERQRLRQQTGEHEVDELIVIPEQILEQSRACGNNRNMFIANDCSYAVAHGLELTFSFNNTIAQNRFVQNAICGIWGGYSQNTTIADNIFESNGEMAYGLERGGVNIEHGRNNWIQANTFRGNKCGVHFWWDPDEGLTKLPWAKVNNTDADRNVIYGNTFDGDEVAIHLRETDKTFIIANETANVDEVLRADEKSKAGIQRELDAPPLRWSPPEYEPLGETSPVGARDDLTGRERIIMTEWGPYDWQSPLLTLVEKTADRHVYRMLGKEKIQSISLEASNGDVIQHELDDSTLTLTTTAQNHLIEYTIIATTESGPQRVSNTFMPLQWDVLCFAYETDPREDVAKWRQEAADHQRARATLSSLDLTFGMGGPSNAGITTPVDAAQLPNNHFGTFASTKITLPPGTWRINTTSDDGVRVWLNEKIIIDDWTWHGPTKHNHEFKLDESRELAIRIEHFELDGYAILSLVIERVDEQGE